MYFKKAVLLIHGFAGGINDYGDLSNYLQLHSNYDVYTFTLPGHDKLFITKVTYEDWIKAAEEEIELLINNGYKNICVIGHSMGGVITSYLANKYVKYVKKVVLAAPAFKYMYFKNDKMDIIKSLSKSSEIFGGLDTHTVLSRILKVPIPTAKQFAKLVELYHDEPEKITCPILTIHGTEDKMVPRDSCEYVFNSVKSKTNILIAIEKVNHDCFTGKRKEEVYEVITKFINKSYLFSTKEKKEYLM